MKGTLIALGLFAAGVLTGFSGIVPDSWDIGLAARIILYVLIFQVGLGLGADGGLARVRKSLTPRILMLPVCTVVGTVLFSALAGLAISAWSTKDCISVGCGFGYYSLSSIIISGMKEASLGPDGAAALAALALMTNMTREILSIAGAPLLVRLCGRTAPVVAAGVTSMDSALPAISRSAGADIVPVALVHGMVLEVATPVLVTFFCSL